MTKEEKLEATRQWRKENKEKIREYNKEYRKNNPDKIKNLKKDWDTENKEHRKEYSKKYLKENPYYHADKHLKYSYGISLEDFNDMRQKANYRCQGCGKHEEETPRKRLFVDHCHETGAIRGLLCQQCNTALGMTNDDPAVLASLIAYLRENGNKEFNNGS
jgi:hypothetical protein